MALSLHTVLLLLFPRRAAAVLQGRPESGNRRGARPSCSLCHSVHFPLDWTPPMQAAAVCLCEFLLSSSHTCLYCRRVILRVIRVCARIRHCTPGTDRRHCI